MRGGLIWWPLVDILNGVVNPTFRNVGVDEASDRRLEMTAGGR
jgi:hypothetical protein